MNIRVPLAIVVPLALLAPHMAHAQIPTHCRRRSTRRGSWCRSATLCACRRRWDGSSRPGREPGRVGAGQFSFTSCRTAPPLPTTSAVTCICWMRTPAPSVYLDFITLFPNTVYNRLQSGFIGFGFPPRVLPGAGLSIPCTAERAFGNPGTPDFLPPGYSDADVAHHNVITEWRAYDPAADVFDGTRRELLRVAQVTTNMSHPFGFVGFNPTSGPGDPDYGLLYTSGSDLGFSNGVGPNSENPGQTQRLDSVVTAILRFDPRSPPETGGTAGLGD